MVHRFGVAEEDRGNDLSVDVLKLRLVEILARFVHSLEEVLQLLAALVVLDIVHAEDELEALVLDNRLMLIFSLVVQKLVWIAAVEQHGLADSYYVWMVQAGHYVESLNLLHPRIHMLPVPLPAIYALVLRYFETVGCVSVDRHKLPRLILSVHAHLIHAAKRSFAQEVLLRLQLVVGSVRQYFCPIRRFQILILRLEIPLEILVQQVLGFSHEMLKHVVDEFGIEVAEE